LHAGAVGRNIRFYCAPRRQQRVACSTLDQSLFASQFLWKLWADSLMKIVNKWTIRGC
jgi:hypothetical protein